MLKFKVVGQEKLLVPDVEQQYHINPLDDFRWVAGADVQKVWRKHGWVPPSEYREDYLFKKNREAK
jgi:hypothetical protein